MKINLKGMSRKDLEKLRADVDKALTKVSKVEKAAALEAAKKAAAAHGFSLSELTGSAKSAAPKAATKAPAAAKRKSAAVPRFANPADASQTWTGKGRQPNWFKDAVAGGADPSSMAI